MMKERIQNVEILVKRLLTVLLFFTLLRLIFFVFHQQYFDVSTAELIEIFFFGLRFDLAVIFAVNLILIFLYLLPLPLMQYKPYRIFVRSLFLILNILAFLFYTIDLQFFKLYQRRISFPELQTSLKDISLINIIEFFAHYWASLLVFLLISLLFVMTNRKIKFRKARIKNKSLFYFIQALIFLIGLGFSVLMIRGGVQLKPLDIVAAGKYAKSKQISLLTNNPFVIIKTLNENPLPDIGSHDCVKYRKGDSFIKSWYDPQEKTHQKNVVIIILESFSKEFMGSLNPNYKGHADYRTYTPFLDSLAKESFTCKNAFANDENSMRALPTIVAGTPTLMNNHFPQSIYIQNSFRSLADILKDKNYQSAFFHGGKNGTMSFDALIKLQSFDRYYGMNEYPNKAHFDGKWGIFDHKFFSFMADELDQMQEPFLSVLFSLSNHTPFILPDTLKDKFDSYEKPIQRTAAYTDFALQKFFQRAKATEWYQNTLFVITADHQPRRDERYKAYYKKGVGGRQIPIIFFDPSNQKLKKQFKLTAQQIDIFPSILDYLNYEKPVYALGNSLFDKNAKRFAITYLGKNRYLYIKDSLAIYTRHDSIDYIFNYKKDSLLEHKLTDLALDFRQQLLEEILCFGKEYNEAMRTNELTFENKMHQKHQTSWQD